MLKSADDVRLVDDVDELRRFLLKDPISRAYQLGDLGDAYFPYTTWYASGGSDDIRSLLLVYTGLSLPVMISVGETEGVAAILEQYGNELPGRAMLHMQPEHLEAVDRDFACESLRPMLRMGMNLEDFRPVESDGPLEINQLSMGDIGEIIALYHHYPDNFFEPAQLSTGHYYGIRTRGKLVSVAGVHVFSAKAKVACLGNIVTHPEQRGRGLSTMCTSHLCGQLARAGTDVFALNVDRHNTSAVRVYRKLGFHEHATYVEGEVTAPLRRSR